VAVTYPSLASADILCNTVYSLSEDDKRVVAAFFHKLKHNVTNACFRDIPHAYPGAGGTPSWKACQLRVGKISGLKPKLYDMCINSCLCYTGHYADLLICPYCKEMRHNARGRARRRFSYIPLIPRLRALWENEDMAKLMEYRGKFTHDPETIKDIFDGLLYRSLLGKHVQPVGGPTQRHQYFERDTDMVLGLSTDGYAPFRRRAKTAWPLLLFNYNLPPDIRFHQDNMLSLGVIPGPNKPKDFDSFLWPLVEELLELELGVLARDGRTQKHFHLRAHLLLVFGDMPAISMVMNMKGHNGFCPCRFCEIRGARIPGNVHSPYYVPLDRSKHPNPDARAPGGKAAYDPLHLPRRTHTSFMDQAREVQSAPTATAANERAKFYGVKAVPILSFLSTISFPHSFPVDFMHLVWENVVKNLFSLWFGDYKGLGTGTGDYKVPPKVVELIGKESADAGDFIPTAFGPRPPNIASDKISWTADTRAFWTLHLGPRLLRGRLPERYFLHFIDLIKLLHTCLEFEMEHAKLADLRQGFADWVLTYEKCVHFFVSYIC
jgi:hypothetical protein